MDDGRRALITGIEGQDGSYLAELLLDRGYDVWGTARVNPEAERPNLSAVRDRITVLACDLRDRTALVNLASEYVGVALSENNRVLYSIGKGLTLLVLFALKYLDALWARAPRSRNIASVLCATAEK